MSVKSDKWIKKMAKEEKMIEPFAEEQIREGVISYGLSSYGYDFRLADEFLVFKDEKTPGKVSFLDPKKGGKEFLEEYKGKEYLLPPGYFLLGRSLEYFRIPRKILVIIQGKSTYARCGIVVNVTPFEPEWEGYATLAISNTGPLPVKIYALEGIAQAIFLESDQVCSFSYADKKGKYQKQERITLSKI
jgi:dCTP deaminase